MLNRLGRKQDFVPQTWSQTLNLLYQTKSVWCTLNIWSHKHPRQFVSMFTKKAKLGERAQANASKLSQLEALSCSQLPWDVFETGDGGCWWVFWYSALSKCIYQSIGTARKCPSSIIQSGIHRQIQQNVKHVSYPACKESIDWTELSHFFCILENCRSNFKLGLYTSF